MAIRAPDGANKNIELGNSSKIPAYQNKAKVNKCNSNYSSYLDDHNEDNENNDLPY